MCDVLYKVRGRAGPALSVIVVLDTNLWISAVFVGDGGVMPGKMRGALERILSSVGRVSRRPLKCPKSDDVAASDLRPEIECVYRSLGGILRSVPHFKLRPWDIEFDGIAVELDESLHFNRYRGVTLGSASYASLPCFPFGAYQRFCSEHEDICLKNGGYGGKWSNTSCERQFGEASQPGVLPEKVTEMEHGAPRWKQRAFYDFVKDLSPMLIGVKVVRIAVWEETGGADGKTTVGETLDAAVRTSAHARSASPAAQVLAALIRKRAAD